jgi:hypothetical protein
LGVLALPLGLHIVLADTHTTASIAGRPLHTITHIKYVSLPYSSSSSTDQQTVDQQYLWILDRALDARQLFGSYSYDITNTLQTNTQHNTLINHNLMFNYYIANKLLQLVPYKDRKTVAQWIMPIIQGYVGQISKNIHHDSLY